MPITIDVPPIHCALCRADLVRAVEQTGAVVTSAALGASSLVLEGVGRDLDAIRAAVASVTHPTSPGAPPTSAT